MEAHNTPVILELALPDQPTRSLVPYGRLANGASLATRTLVKGTRNVLSRLGTERAIEVVRDGQAGQVTGVATLDRGLAQLGHVSKALSFADNFAAWLTGEHAAAIAYPDVTRMTVAGDEEEVDRNYLLQKAIRLYMDQHYEVHCEDMLLSLVPAQANQQEADAPGEDHSKADSGFGGAYQQLKSFVVSSVPVLGKWIELDPELRLWFQMNKEQRVAGVDELTQKQVMVEVIIYNLKAYGADARGTVQTFITDAWMWYLEQRKTSADRARYFLQARLNAKAEANSDAARGPKGRNVKAIDRAQYQFKKYLLRDQKTFESLFFAAKPQLLALVDDFLNKAGKFAISGFPQKLGLLLYGPPGTGKTSIIKALSAYTGRHVVSINLRQIGTNQELFDLFFDLVFHTVGEEMPLKFSFEDVIFVMEEVDRAGNLVRGSAERQAEMKGSSTQARQSRHGLRHSGAPGESDPSELVEQLEKIAMMEEALAKGVVPPELAGLCAQAKLSLTSQESKEKQEAADKNDQVDLQGLLQVFDGVVDSPGRLIVMTTNVDPSLFDQALVRPGRINWCMHLGFIKEPEVMFEMSSHYLQHSPPSREQVAQATALLAGFDFTPATLEQLCVEVESLDDLIARMEQKMLSATRDASSEGLIDDK